MPNRYKKLFAVGKELGMQIWELREGAASYTGQRSLSSLNNAQLKDYENKLNRRNFQRKRKIIISQFEVNNLIPERQREMLIDLIASAFPNIYKFRAWHIHYFQSPKSERFFDSLHTRKVIKALLDMRKRGYRIK